MTDFGRWLRESNGKQMLSDIAKENVSSKQMRAAITTYCILFDINVDSREWDELMRWLWKYYNSWFDEFETMDMFMCADLV